ncbi:hypothetical protein EBR96_09430 [bacterium]|nr:hypothetical protein [bacterium]
MGDFSKIARSTAIFQSEVNFVNVTPGPNPIRTGGFLTGTGRFAVRIRHYRSEFLDIFQLF